MSTSFSCEHEVLYKDLEAECVNLTEEDVGAPGSKYRESVDLTRYESYAAPLPDVPPYVSDCPEYLANLISPHGRGTVDVDAIDADNMEAIRRTGHTYPVTTVSLQLIEGQHGPPPMQNTSFIMPFIASTDATEASQKRKAPPTVPGTEGSSSGSHEGMSKRRKLDLENIAPSVLDEDRDSDPEETDDEDEDFVPVASSSSSRPLQDIQANHLSTSTRKARKSPHVEAEAYAREQCNVMYPDPTSPPIVPCGIGGCSAMVSHGDTAAAVCHWRDHHPDKSNDTPIQCTWAVDGETCTVQKKYTDLERHWVVEHFGVRWKCPVQGLQCKNHRSIKRRDQLDRFRKVHADQAAKMREKEQAKAR